MAGSSRPIHSAVADPAPVYPSQSIHRDLQGPTNPLCPIELTETDYKYIKYERLIPYLVNNIKYLNSKIVELENKLK